MEVAGLALAIFPLVVKGLGVYLDATQKIKDVKDYKKVLRPLVRQLEMEKCKFVNTCEILLEGMVLAEEVDTSKAFVDAVGALTSHLQELGNEIGLVEGKQPLDKASQKRQWKKIKPILQQQSYVTVLNQIKAINADLVQLTMQRPPTTAIRKPNQLSPAAINYNRIRSHAKGLYVAFQERFRATRCSCKITHNASLRLEKPAVDCKDQIDIRLEVLFDFEAAQGSDSIEKEWRALKFRPVERVSTTPKSQDDINSGVQQLDMENPGSSSKETRSSDSAAQQTLVGDTMFRAALLAVKQGIRRKKVLFQVQQELPVRMETDKLSVIDAIDTAKRIENLCSVIKNTVADCSDSCIGIIFDECNRPWHRIWAPATLLSYSSLTEAVSLESLLAPGCLEKKDRLELGVRLAFAVMQLHSTEWLSDCWGKQDIFFLQRAVRRRALCGGFVLVGEPVIDKPFVRRTFGSSEELYLLHPNTVQNTAPATETATLVEYDRSLFSLGIILIELWLERGIEELRLPFQNQDGDTQGQRSDNTDYRTAQGRIGEIFTYAGDDYGLAVSRCINGLSRHIDNARAILGSLESEDFKNDVHTNVVFLLERNLEGRAIWPTEGTGEGGRNLELELKCEPGLEREPKHEHELEFELELELELELEPELGLNESLSLG
ncbi:hypothetical protein BDD12DRAFT_895321 [Trichophaea hybrida]|nr:hypothetical protein BDD12DRAFT_895321 [Trichophaea hybrida]